MNITKEIGCKDCTFFEKTGVSGPYGTLCRHPILLLHLEDDLDCFPSDACREVVLMCGASAKWFVAKPHD